MRYEYFTTSKERYKALLMLMGVILAVVGIVGVMALFASWNVGFWAALTEMNLPLFLESIQSFVILTVSYMGLSILQDYLVGVLSINWRNWLTKKLIAKYTSPDGNNYLDLERHPSELENPPQRIQEDVKSFVDQTFSLGINILRSILITATFIGTLWVVGGSLTIASITIPGYLVWTVLLYSSLSTGLTYLIGGSLKKLTNDQQNLEAEFRSSMENMGNDAESVAQDHGEAYYQQSLNNRFRAVNNNSYKILGVRIRLNTLNAFYQQISIIIPYLLSAPLYFSGLIGLGQLFEIGMAFSQIQWSLSWFSNSFENFAQYRASAERITALKNSLNDDGLTTTEKSIVVQKNDFNELSVHNLNVQYPSSTDFMIRKLNLTLRPGENTWIKGDSGLGKSTLFKVIAGTWKYGTGDVSITNNKKLCFLPQRPSLPNDTLKAVLAYPESVETYTNEQYVAVLQEVGDLDRFTADLDSKAPWSKRLSLGQQQRLSFARAILKKPDWLFLDEATASLDDKAEQRMYTLIKNKLRGTTFVSIAHKNTVARFHDRVIFLSVDESRNACLSEGEKPAGVMDAANDADSMLAAIPKL